MSSCETEVKVVFPTVRVSLHVCHVSGGMEIFLRVVNTTVMVGLCRKETMRSGGLVQKGNNGYHRLYPNV